MKNYNGKIHHRWKGDNAGYCAKHTRLYRRYGKPNFCEGCGTENAKRFHWANITGVYTISKENWLRLCASCHLKYDYTEAHREAVRRNAIKGHEAVKRPIIQFNKNKTVLNTYQSITEASKHTGILITSIANMLANRSKTAGGFLWRYSS